MTRTTMTSSTPMNTAVGVDNNKAAATGTDRTLEGAHEAPDLVPDRPGARELHVMGLRLEEDQEMDLEVD